jgi:Zn-dependent peptidase ImmA (M78 family)/transcriptional regulator with XRE-family HTH domain
MAQPNAALVTLIREYRGLTQGELAHAAGLSQGYVSKVEHEQLVPSDDAIEKMAAVLEWPIPFFFRTDQVYGFGTACMFHRKQASLPVHKLRSVQAKVNVLRIGLTPLLREIASDTAGRVPLMDVDAYEGGPPQIAQLVRAAWQLPLGPIANLTATLEVQGGIVYRVDFGTRQLDAVSHWSPDIPPLFFVNTTAPPDRIRYSLAHELGHVVMHAMPTPDMEAEANQFASEFLMPEREIRSMLGGLDLSRAAQLKAYWRVSMQALILRARDLGIISRQKASRLYMQMSSLGYRRVEPVALPVEEPTALRGVMDTHRQVHGFTIGDLAERVGLPESDFENHFVADRPTLRALR